MTPAQFYYLLTLVQDDLTSYSKCPSLDPELKLAFFLNLIGHGNCVMKSALMFRIGESTAYKIIEQVSLALVNNLMSKFLEFPDKNKWLEISREIHNDCKFPHCLGFIDGRHFRVNAPPKAGSKFYSPYKKCHTVVPMGTCDANCKFTWASVGNYGSLNDAANLANTSLYQALENDEVDLPDPEVLPGCNEILPYYFLGDGGFPLKNFLMTPYGRLRRPLSLPEKVYNRRLSRGRRLIENSFAYIVRKWRIFEASLNFKLNTTNHLIMATLLIHNYLITFEMDLEERDRRYIDEIVEENLIFDEFEEDDVLDDAASIRETLKQFFNSTSGMEQWQWFIRQYI